MLQKHYASANPLGKNDIVNTHPYWAIPRSPEPYIMNCTIYDALHCERVYSTQILIDTTYVTSTGNDGYIYSFIGNDMVRVQYNRELRNIEPMDTIYVKPIPDSIKINDKEYAIVCFDGMFDSFFARARGYGVNIDNPNLCALQNVKHIVFKDPPKRILSMNEIFRNLPLLETIDISNWEIPPWCLDDDMFHPFVNCPRLREIIIKDRNVTTDHLRRWLTYNFEHLTDHMPITARTVSLYNTNRYVFTDDIAKVMSRREYEKCYDKDCLTKEHVYFRMNEFACGMFVKTGLTYDDILVIGSELLSEQEWNRNNVEYIRNNVPIKDFPERYP